MVEDGDVVEIDYIGRVQDSGEIFDLTSEEVAEEEGYETQEMELGPVKALIGAGHVIAGLEDALKEMSAGDTETVQVDAEDAFGSRSSDNVKTFSEREFDEYDVQPRRGLVVEIDGRRGKIISASSGRVRVDFNHPLAGKDLEYEVEVLNVLESAEDRAEAVLEYYGMDEMEHDVAVDDSTLTLSFTDGFDNAQLRQHMEEELALVKGVETVEIQ